MSEELLDLVECCPIVDERAGKAVAQIVNAHVLQAKFIANSIPLSWPPKTVPLFVD